MRSRRMLIAIVLLTGLTVMPVAASTDSGTGKGSAEVAAPSGSRASDSPASVAQSSEIISWAYDQVAPAVAFNPDAGQYLAVWEDHHWGNGANWSIYCHRVGADGGLIGSRVSIAYGGKNHVMAPDVVYHPTIQEYLVVWEYAQSSSNHDIYAHRVGEDGSLPGDEIHVAALTKSESNPAVAYNSQDDEYLVVWERREGSGETAHFDIIGQRLDPSGDAQGAAFTIATGLLDQLSPAVAFDPATNQYLVVWEDFSMPVAGAGVAGPTVVQSDIYGQRVAANGSLAGGLIPISTWEYDQVKPRLAFNTAAHEFMVVWEDHHWGEGEAWSVYGRRVGTTGALLGGLISISYGGAHHVLAPDVA